MGRGERGLLAIQGAGASHSAKIIRVGAVNNTDTEGIICVKNSRAMMFTMFVPLCIISTMNDAEDYAGLDNDGVVVSVQLSSGWRKTWPEAPPESL